MKDDFTNDLMALQNLQNKDQSNMDTNENRSFSGVTPQHLNRNLHSQATPENMGEQRQSPSHQPDHFNNSFNEAVNNLMNEQMGTNLTLDHIKEAEVENDDEDDNIIF